MKGKSITPLVYDDAFPFYNGYASVRKDGNWFYIDENGNKPLPEDYVLGYGPIIDRNAIVYDNVVRSSNKINPLLSATL
ncbi:MAG: hypothetical protein BGO88_03165 [Flavobacterium sp. 38-13]|uniref:WG repeat-containing protein n=1 Tax=Flavobacterium sp. 38-13 TaxID=1896168 RepID=UPI000966874B|nr:WG repeat-containing protein [Flavobacterium sp. 38-13]OJX54887.1 MAG: hypothetical protein BGO88_03165 [Flavobacterium sp. 38-13]